ncbi:MAG: vWA domain-containing protein [Pirellulales bacterium]
MLSADSELQDSRFRRRISDRNRDEYRTEKQGDVNRKSLQRWWQELTGVEDTPLDAESSSWLISLAVHLGALILLAGLTLLIPTERRVLLSAIPVDLTEEIIPEEFRFDENPHEEIGALADSGAAQAAPSAPIESMVSEVMLPAEATASFGEIQAIDIDQPLLQGPESVENVIVKGVGMVGVTGSEGAIDRITNEILLSLDTRPTLVVWLFDQSGSLSAQREDIAKRFDRVYDELGVIEAAGRPEFASHDDKPLLTAVAAFGERVQLLTNEPTDDVADIKAAVRSITDDQSGKENIFAAVLQLADKFRSYRLRSPRRNVMFVIFTDEAGDDFQNVDPSVATCRKYEMPIYVVGVPAPFGRRQAYVNYVDPDPKYDQTPRFLPVDQGPESLMPESVQLGFIDQNPYDSLDSGFGPYGLTRLAYETGGIYFAVHPSRTHSGRPRTDRSTMAAYLSKFFDPRVMRSYRPDYVPVAEYQQELTRNRAKGALVAAAQFSWTEPMEDVRLVFEKIDEARFSEALSVAQRVAAKIEPRLLQIVGTLRQGEPDRSKLLDLRWQAGFDLAMGRSLAHKVRTEGYNAMLAKAKQGMKFEKENSDTWVLKPSDNVTSESVLAKEAEQARAYLQRVTTEHEGTPWAYLAERELEVPFGWEWQEDFRDIAGRIARAQENAGNRRNEPRPEMPAPKPVRDVKL